MPFFSGSLRDSRREIPWLTLLVLNACGQEILHVATWERDEPPGGTGGDSSAAVLDCVGGTPENVLPLGAAFGEGEALEPWPFTTAGYGASQGPGLLVTARDSFRVYVNGHLTAESSDARTPVFLPVSLLPGENVIAVAVSSASGTPAALIQLDELERTYVSDGLWKLSRAPEGDWQSPGYDDSTWSQARELAAVGAVPGCDPVDVSFNPTARWIGPSPGTTGPIALRRTVRVQPMGFGAGTTGGAGASPVVISTWEELESLADSEDPQILIFEEGTYDFRRTGDEVADQEVCPIACPNDPDKTLYQVLLGEETCPNPLATVQRNDRRLQIKSNKTILGLGRGAAVRGVTFDFQESLDIIVRNIAAYDINPGILEAGDAFSLNRPTGVWIDHATAKWVSDGLTDMREGTRGVTLSYMLFDGENEQTCDGQHRWTGQFSDTEATVHHSRFDQVSSRAPLVYGPESRVHLLNNVASNNLDWAFGSSCDAQVLVEGNTFENVVTATFRGACDGGGLGLMRAPAGSNLYRDDSDVHLGGDGQEPQDDVFTPPYDYEVEPPAEAWPRVVSRAGAGGPWALPLVRD